ncbi:hypothetical protein E4U14_004605 [Claviceps sp. LM454 group G7]|nr:hypothetical protein E4U14_004605 [Claviceps sp. LM454 group G7]
MKDFKYIISDEKSMTGLRALRNIDQRLRQIYAHLNTPFGGRSFLHSGDFAQLPPVFDKPLYRQGSLTTAADAHARLIKWYGKLVMTKKAFETLWLRYEMATRRRTRVHLDLLCTRIEYWYWLSPADVAIFKDALRIYSYNGEHLKKIETPSINNSCNSTGLSGTVASRDAGNLQQQLRLCIGESVVSLISRCNRSVISIFVRPLPISRRKQQDFK